MGWFRNIFRNKTRERALSLGIEICEVERQIPVFYQDNRFKELVSDKCVRYSLPSISRNLHWELLQRDEDRGAQLPNGYLLKSINANNELIEKLRVIAEEFPEEYFEFESNSKHVAVFWGEWGGVSQADKIHRTLLLMQNLKV